MKAGGKRGAFVDSDSGSEELVVNAGIRKRKGTSSTSIDKASYPKGSRTSSGSSAKKVPSFRGLVVQVPSSLAGDVDEVDNGDGDDNGEASGEEGTLIVHPRA